MNQTQLSFIKNEEIYEKVLLEPVMNARSFVWLATSDIKDLYVHKGKRMVPLLEILSDLIKKGVAIRLIHAKEPGSAFRNDFDRFPELYNGLERLLCPRVHFKSVVVDGVFAYMGSANLTGAGMGAKSIDKRNFESGITTNDAGLIRHIMDQFDFVWIGRGCETCKRVQFCPDHKIMDE